MLARYMPRLARMEGIADVLMGAAIEDCVRSKQTANRRQYYIVQLERVLRRFAEGIEDLPVSLVSSADVESWVNSGSWSAGTRKTVLNRLGTFFLVCREAQVLRDKPRWQPGRSNALFERGPGVRAVPVACDNPGYVCGRAQRRNSATAMGKH